MSSEWEELSGREVCFTLWNVLQSLHVDARSFCLEADLDKIDKLVHYCLSGLLNKIPCNYLLEVVINSKVRSCKHLRNNYIIPVTYFRCFDKDSVEEIILALEAEGSDWSKKQLEVYTLIVSCYQTAR